MLKLLKLPRYMILILIGIIGTLYIHSLYHSLEHSLYHWLYNDTWLYKSLYNGLYIDSLGFVHTWPELIGILPWVYLAFSGLKLLIPSIDRLSSEIKDTLKEEYLGAGFIAISVVAIFIILGTSFDRKWDTIIVMLPWIYIAFQGAQMLRPQASWHILAFLAPAVIIYTLFMVYPLIDSLRLGFYGANPEIPQQEIFVGIANYEKLLTNELWTPRLVGAIKNNFIFFAIHMLVQNPIGLLLAVLLSSQFIKGRSIYRTLIFIPTVLSVVLVGFVWRLILSPLWGIAKDILIFFGAGDVYQPWLGQEESALIALSLVSVWQYVGIPMMLFLAALISIPDELIEAARVDGASALEIFWRIKLPLIMPTVGVVSVLTFVGNFNAFDLIFTVQGASGNPNFATDILGTFFYRTFFGQQLQAGDANLGAAVAGIMFLIILAGVLLYLFGFQRRVTQYEF